MHLGGLGSGVRTKLALGGMTCLGLGLLSANYLPNTIFLDELEGIVQLYRHSIPVQVPEKVLRRFEKVTEDMGVSTMDRKLLKPFTVYGFDIFHAGSTFTNLRAIIGIPSNFHYSNVKEVETENIMVLNEPVDWESEAGKNFKECFVLSEEAQKYLIGQEIYIAQSPFLFLRSVYPPTALSIVYHIGCKLNRTFNLFERPFLVRGILYALLGIFGIGLWACAQDITTAYYEKQADQVMLTLGEEYRRGGLEAYTKILQRNIALRELMGRKGPRQYTACGNDVYFLRQKHLPITSRKTFFETSLNDHKEAGDRISDNPVGVCENQA